LCFAKHGVETMTIDERLERLTDRHEELTMTVELMSREGDHILALARIAEAHENRLERIEGVQ
jgi:archaellum component FlaC